MGELIYSIYNINAWLAARPLSDLPLRGVFSTLAGLTPRWKLYQPCNDASHFRGQLDASSLRRLPPFEPLDQPSPSPHGEEVSRPLLVSLKSSLPNPHRRRPIPTQYGVTLSQRCEHYLRKMVNPPAARCRLCEAKDRDRRPRPRY